MRRYSALLAVAALAAWSPGDVQAQGAVHRLAANYNAFGGGEITFTIGTDSPPVSNGEGGKVIYTHTVTVPAGDNTLYVTVSGTGEANSGQRVPMFLGCLVGINPCNPFKGGPDAPTGWIQVLEGFDLVDQNFSYTWCKAVTAGTKTVRVKVAATGNSGITADIEGLHYYIDSSKITSTANRCAGDSD